MKFFDFLPDDEKDDRNNPMAKEPDGDLPQGDEKTDNDVEALRALDEAMFSDFEFDADGYWENHLNALPEETGEELLTAPRQKGPRKKRRWGGMLAAASLVLLLAAGVVIAEPWVPATVDDYEDPQTARFLEPLSLAVGESYELEIECGENEVVSIISTLDSDILAIDGDTVTALGQWPGASVRVETREKEVPPKEQKELNILGIDLTTPYNSARSWLRNLLGIEEIEPARTELRVLNRYELVVNVEGYAIRTAAVPINIYTEDTYQFSIPQLLDSENVRFEQSEDLVAIDTEPDDGGNRIFSVRSSGAEGTAIVTATVGFYKDEIFVPVRAYVYNLEIRSRYGESPSAFANGDYNGLVPITDDSGETGEESPEQGG